MARFSDALDRSLETIKRPPPVPMGHFIFRVSAPVSPTEVSKDGKWEFLTVQAQTVSAMDDVDPDELAAFGNIAGKPMQVKFIFNTDPAEEQAFENTLNRVKTFIRNCGVDADNGALKERLAELVNTQFIGEVKHRLDPNDSEIVYAEINRTAAVE